MKKSYKEVVVQEVSDKLSNAAGVVLTNYKGLNVEQITELRKRLREAGVEYKVTKNTLTLRAANENNIEGLEEYLTGPIALAFSYEDPVTPAKVLAKFIKEYKKVEMVAGILKGQVVDKSAVQRLAELPSREELVANAVRGISSPLTGLVTVLSGPMRNLVYALNAVKDQKESA